MVDWIQNPSNLCRSEVEINNISLVDRVKDKKQSTNKKQKY